MPTGTKTPRLFTWPWIGIPLGLVVLAIGIGVAAVWMTRGGQPAAPAAAGPAITSAPIATAPNAPSANVPSPVANGLTPGKFPSSQIKTSSPNLVLAVFAAGLEGDPRAWSLYIPQSPEANEVFSELKLVGSYGWPNSWILIGGVVNVADLTKVIRPSDAPEGRYASAAILALPSPDGGAVVFVRVAFFLEKAAGSGWWITKLASPVHEMWNRSAFELELKRMKSTPGNVFNLQ